MPGVYGKLTRGAGGGDAFEAMTRALSHKPWFVHQEVSTASGPVGKLSLPAIAGGKQSATSSDGRVTLMLDGYLTNSGELAVGSNVNSGTPPSSAELALELYLRHSMAFVTHLEGSFNLLVADERYGAVVIANDRFGHRPLYYHSTDKALVFAPELKGVVAGSNVPREIDWQAAGDLFVFGHVWGDKTLLNEVKMLDGAHAIVWTPQETNVLSYWSLAYGATRKTDETACIADLDAVFRGAATRYRQIEGRRLLMLSGGLDSRMTACYLAEQGVEFDTASLNFSSLPSNDALVAEQVSKELNRPFSTVSFDVSDPAAVLNEFLQATEGMVTCAYHINALPLSQMREHYDLYLHGNGGNILFGDYATQYLEKEAQLPGEDVNRVFAMFQAVFNGTVLSQTFAGDYVNRLWSGAQESFIGAYAVDNQLSGAEKWEWLSWVQRMRRSTTTSTTVVSSYMEPMCMIGDSYGFVDEMAGVALGLKVDQRWYKNCLRQFHPEMAALPHVSKTIHPLFEDGPGSDLEEYSLDTPLDGFYWNTDYLLRNDYREYYESVLLDRRTLDRPWFNGSAIEGMWQSEQKDNGIHGAQLGTILAFEHFCRTFID